MKAHHPLLDVLLATALLAAFGCPSQTAGPQTTPKSPEPQPAEVTYKITVTADPPELTVGSGTPSTLTVDVRLTGSGQRPPDLTPVALSTNLGSFGSVGGPTWTLLQLIDGRSRAALFAGSSAGTATASATTRSSSGGVNVPIARPEPFSVNGIVPNVGGLRGGEPVEITGTGFDPPVAVRIGNAAASVVSVSPDRLRVITPKALAATGRDLGEGGQSVTSVEVDINVNEANPQSAALTNGFTYAADGNRQPRIGSPLPASDTTDGAIRWSSTGREFGQPVSRRVNVLAKNRNTGAASILPAAFRHDSPVRITAMGPGSGPYTGGTRVTLSSPGFEGPVAVSLGGIGQVVNKVRDREIVFTTAGIPVSSCPASGFVTATGVRVIDTDTGASDDADFSFNYLVPLPRVFGVSPAGGGVGTTLTITGVNFAPNVQVQLGDPLTGTSAQVLYVNPTTVVARVPTPTADFAFHQLPCGTQGRMDAPTPISITVRNLDGPGCFVTFTNGFLLKPSDAATSPPRLPRQPLFHRLLHPPTRTHAPVGCQAP